MSDVRVSSVVRVARVAQFNTDHQANEIGKGPQGELSVGDSLTVPLFGIGADTQIDDPTWFWNSELMSEEDAAALTGDVLPGLGVINSPLEGCQAAFYVNGESPGEILADLLLKPDVLKTVDIVDNQ